MKSKRLLLMASAFILTLAFALGSLLPMFNFRLFASEGGGDGGDLPDPTVDTMVSVNPAAGEGNMVGRLLSRSGTQHNVEMATEFMRLATRAERTTVQSGDPTNGQIRIDANALRVANNLEHDEHPENSQLPEVQLLQFIPVNAAIGTANAHIFTENKWRLVYVTYPKNGNVHGDPIFTFVMTSPYKESRFNGNNAYSASNNYNQSLLRDTIVGDFANSSNGILRNYQNVSRFILPSSAVKWQQNQPDIDPAHNNNLSNSTDLIWIPSAYEMGLAGDLWGLSPEEKGFTQPTGATFSTRAWFRSAFSGYEEDDPLDPVQNMQSYQTASVVPAVHVSLWDIIRDPLNAAITRAVSAVATEHRKYYTTATMHRLDVAKAAATTALDNPALSFQKFTKIIEEIDSAISHMEFDLEHLWEIINKNPERRQWRDPLRDYKTAKTWYAWVNARDAAENYIANGLYIDITLSGLLNFIKHYDDLRTHFNGLETYYNPYITFVETDKRAFWYLIDEIEMIGADTSEYTFEQDEVYPTRQHAIFALEDALDDITFSQFDVPKLLQQIWDHLVLKKDEYWKMYQAIIDKEFKELDPPERKECQCEIGECMDETCITGPECECKCTEPDKLPELLLPASEYTAKSWQAYENAKQHTWNLLNDKRAKKEELLFALDDMRAAQNALVIKPPANDQRTKGGNFLDFFAKIPPMMLWGGIIAIIVALILLFLIVRFIVKKKKIKKEKTRVNEFLNKKTTDTIDAPTTKKK